MHALNSSRGAFSNLLPFRFEKFSVNEFKTSTFDLGLPESQIIVSLSAEKLVKKNEKLYKNR